MMNMKQSVTFLEGHVEFGGAPRTGEGAFLVEMMAVIDGFLEQGDVPLCAACLLA